MEYISGRRPILVSAIALAMAGLAARGIARTGTDQSVVAFPCGREAYTGIVTSTQYVSSGSFRGCALIWLEQASHTYSSRCGIVGKDGQLRALYRIFEIGNIRDELGKTEGATPEMLDNGVFAVVFAGVLGEAHALMRWPPVDEAIQQAREGRGQYDWHKELRTAMMSKPPSPLAMAVLQATRGEGARDGIGIYGSTSIWLMRRGDSLVAQFVPQKAIAHIRPGLSGGDQDTSLAPLVDIGAMAGRAPVPSRSQPSTAADSECGTVGRDLLSAAKKARNARKAHTLSPTDNSVAQQYAVAMQSFADMLMKYKACKGDEALVRFIQGNSLSDLVN